MMKRTPIQRKPGSLKKSGKIKCKVQSPEERMSKEIARQLLLMKDKEFYESIWKIRKHDCEVHYGYMWLGLHMKKMFFDHLIEKSTHPELRYEPKNIALCCGDCHSQKTSGFPTEKHKERIEQAKRELL